MKFHRFLGDFNLDQKEVKVTGAGFISQLINVLRLKAGDSIIVADGKLNEAEAEIKKINKHAVILEIIKIYKNQNESARHAILYCGILKKENFELVVQKATEVGVKEIVPLITTRTVKLNLNMDRLKKILKEAAEQSGRGMMPILHDPVNFEKAIAAVKSNKTNLFFDSSGILTPGVIKVTPGVGGLGIFIGPEGGWSEEEVTLAKKNNFEIVSLGKLTLRAETAAIVASYLISSL